MSRSQQQPALRYRLSVPRPETHLLEVELSVDAAGLPDAVELAMAAWCPGSYVIRDYARHVREVEVRDAAGAPLPVTKTSKQTWRVERGDADALVVRYRVYGHELTVRTNHIDDTHAFLHGPATYLYVEALRDRPCLVVVEPPAGRDWHVATGLDPHVEGYRAADVDELFDCPLHLGEVTVRELEAAGRPTRLVIWGDIDPAFGAAGLDELAADLAAIIEAHAARFGGVPYRHYTFMLMLSPDAYGGLEHRNSSANLHSPFAFATRKTYEELLELLSHEFFHVWNGKRIQPAAFDRFDYTSESYTRCLWVVEGLTSYYDRYTVLGAGRLDAGRYLEKLADEWLRLRGQPGRRLHSLEESSFDAWIKLYKPDESNLNTTISYYLKGGLVALALDLEIRRRTEGGCSLAAVLAHLWAEHGAPGRGYPEDLQPLFERATGLGLEEFFARYVRGRQDPDLGAELEHAGLWLDETWESPERSRPAPPPWLGVAMEAGGTRVALVPDGGPAAAAGIGPGDEIVAVDGYRVATEAELRARLAGRRVGQEAALALFRRKRLRVVPAVLGAAPPTRVELATRAEATEAQRDRYRDWLGADYPAAVTVSAATASRWT